MAVRRHPHEPPARDLRERSGGASCSQPTAGRCVSWADRTGIFRVPVLSPSGRAKHRNGAALSWRLGLARMERDKGLRIPLGSGNDAQHAGCLCSVCLNFKGYNLRRALTTDKSRDHPVEAIGRPC